jgi:hypothetical protein
VPRVTSPRRLPGSIITWNPATERKTMKTLVNEVWTQIAYHSDGHLVRTDKRTGKQTVSFRVWLDMASANRTLAEGFGKIRWDEVDGF